VDDDAQRPAGPDRQGRLDGHLALDEALAGLIGGLAGGLLQRLDQIAITGARAEGERLTHAENRR
jgi:hypothetical protein